MSKKAYKFIEDYTKHCSNECEGYSHEWVTPDVARGAVIIAEMELIDRIKSLIHTVREEAIVAAIRADKNVETNRRIYSEGISSGAWQILQNIKHYVTYATEEEDGAITEA